MIEGRPHPATSSPNFYVNLRPSSRNHATIMDGEEFVEGDPCFDKIIDEDSCRVVDQMNGLSMGNGRRLEDGVVII